jgi:hypothetical protein
MAVESKPLFHPEVLRQQVRVFNLPAQAAGWQSTLQHWADLIGSGHADGFKETALLPDFLTQIFCGVLGYTGPAEAADAYTLSRERHVEVDGEFADAVLGRFRKDKAEFVAVLEGKGTRDPLDRPFAGRRMSAVDQAYRYAINLPCDWIIVTSMRETRLYYKGAHQQAYERFETVRLAADEALLKRFVFLLGAERVVPAHRDCHPYELLRASETVGRALTNQFCALYADIRQLVLTRPCRENAAVAPSEILRCTQKLLDRVLFCAFCECRGLLPAESLKHAFEQRNPYNPHPLWHNFRGLFRAIDEGNAGLNIPAYNGGLFATDPALDALQVPDEVCAHFKELGDYDYRPARGKQLTSLDHTICEGNSVISDPAVHPRAFDWQAAFPEVFAQGGFNVVMFLLNQPVSAGSQSPWLKRCFSGLPRSPLTKKVWLSPSIFSLPRSRSREPRAAQFTGDGSASSVLTVSEPGCKGFQIRLGNPPAEARGRVQFPRGS